MSNPQAPGPDAIMQFAVSDETVTLSSSDKQWAITCSTEILAVVLAAHPEFLQEMLVIKIYRPLEDAIRAEEGRVAEVQKVALLDYLKKIGW
jgi:hypothetical protein